MRARIPFSLLGCFLVAAVAAAGCSFSSSSDGFSIEIGPKAWRWERYADERRQLELEIAAGDVLVLEDLNGDVAVAVSGGQPGLEVRLRVHAPTDDEAEAALDRAEIVVERIGREVHVRLSGLESDDVEVTTDYTARVPEGVSLRVRSGSGDIDVDGPLGSVSAATAYGDVNVVHVRGDAILKSASGDIEVGDVVGQRVVATTSYGDVEVFDVVASELVAESRSGDVEIRSVRCEVIKALSSYGDIQLDDTTGDVEARTSSGSIEVAGAGAGDHVLHSGYGSVRIRDAGGSTGGSIRATSSSGDVVLDDVAGRVEAQSGYGDVEVTGVLTVVLAKSSSGSVQVTALRGSTAEADWKLESSYGDVEIRLPSAFSCIIDASTSYGSIDTDSSLDLRPVENGAGEVAAGALGEGGAKVRLHTYSGDVEIRR
ncbi:MAG: DUF4097 family beta strand repeat-containing protein [Planctomycetota bacterium]|nr:DUF4097 family beta strand repeat-containing protein [Planctomycetota bacterium]